MYSFGHKWCHIFPQNYPYSDANGKSNGNGSITVSCKWKMLKSVTSLLAGAVQMKTPEQDHPTHTHSLPHPPVSGVEVKHRARYTWWWASQSECEGGKVECQPEHPDYIQSTRKVSVLVNASVLFICSLFDVTTVVVCFMFCVLMIKWGHK